MRKAMPVDIERIIELGIEALERMPEERLVISRQKVANLAADCVLKNSNFAWVAEKDGKVVGAVCAQVSEMMLYERCQAQVVQYYCPVPGEGVKLILKFLEWAAPRRVIKMIVFAVEIEQDPKIDRMLARLGFNVVEKIWTRMR